MSNWFDNVTRTIASEPLSRRSILHSAFSAFVVGMFSGESPAGAGRAFQQVTQRSPVAQELDTVSDTRRWARREILRQSVQDIWHGENLALDRIISMTPGVGYTERLTITLGDARLLDLLARRSHEGTTEVGITYGDAFKGARRALFYSLDDKVIHGAIEGRRVRPFVRGTDLKSLRFEDGLPPPVSEASPEIQRAIQTIFEKTKLEAAPGKTMHHDPPGPSDPSDTSHSSYPQNTSECNICRGLCFSGLDACTLAASIAAGGCLVFYGVCLAGAIGGCVIGTAICVNGCSNLGAACCPVGCGDSACCDKGETCVDPERGLCCAEGLVGCGTSGCCNRSDTCISATGQCCPKHQNVCNHVCCNPGEVCKENVVCCPVEQEICGKVCCGPGEVCNKRTGNCCASVLCGDLCCADGALCADPDRGLCCGFGREVCDGKCCELGDLCIKGKCCSNPCGMFCCDSNQICCGGSCCPSGEGCLNPKTKKCGGTCHAKLVPCVPDPLGPSICCSANVACCGGDCCKPGEICCAGPGIIFGCHYPDQCIF